jgi:hypothetical protein
MHSEYFLNTFQVCPYFRAIKRRVRIDTKASSQHTAAMPIQTLNNNNKLRLRALWCGAVVYFFILLNELLHIREIPYVTLAMVSLLNGGIFTALVIAIRKIYKERAIQPEVNPAAPTPVAEIDRKRIRVLWIAVSVYLVAFVFAIQFVGRATYHVLLIGGLLNIAVLSTFIALLRREYLNPRRRKWPLNGSGTGNPFMR